MNLAQSIAGDSEEAAEQEHEDGTDVQQRQRDASRQYEESIPLPAHTAAELQLRNR